MIQKLIAVLRSMAKTAQMNHVMGRSEEADRHTIEQFNRILDRLRHVDTTGALEVFSDLPDQTSWASLNSACRNLIACCDVEGGPRRHGWDGFWTDAKSGIWIDKMAFECGLPPEMNEFGEFLKEKISEWQKRKSTARRNASESEV
jgi:hypothetical protein